MSQQKRRSFEAGFKLTVVQFAEQSSNRAAGRKFGVSEKLVRDWKKDADKLNKKRAAHMRVCSFSCICCNNM